MSEIAKSYLQVQHIEHLKLNTRLSESFKVYAHDVLDIILLRSVFEQPEPWILDLAWSHSPFGHKVRYFLSPDIRMIRLYAAILYFASKGPFLSHPNHH